MCPALLAGGRFTELLPISEMVLSFARGAEPYYTVFRYSRLMGSVGYPKTMFASVALVNCLLLRR